MQPFILDQALPRCVLGECPMWDGRRKVLSWIDIEKGLIHEYEMESHKHRQIEVGAPLGFALPAGGGQYIAGVQNIIIAIHPDRHVRTLALLPSQAYVRWNDAKFDSQGRLWCGTMNLDNQAEPQGALYKLSEKGLEKVRNDFKVSNGLDWSPDGRVMYHADTERHFIWAYDFESDTGVISNPRVFIDLKDESPDGLCIDQAGNLYCSIFGGFCLYKFTQQGLFSERIAMPTENITSCIIGGPDNDQLFITTAASDSPTDQWGGHIFRCVIS